MVAVFASIQGSSATARNHSTVAYGIHTIVDWTPAMSFLDIMKFSREFAMHGQGQPAVSYSELKERGVLDENGWPTELDPAYERFVTLWAWKKDSAAIEDRKGVYVLQYEGEGTIEVRNTKVISEKPGEIIFENAAGTTMQLFITETDPNKTGDYIRDVSIVHEDHLELHEAGALFNPKWLELVEDAQLLRFMNWMQGNNSTIENWEDRTTVDSPTYKSKDGVPVEVIIQLANQVGSDPWFTIPHTASDDYVRKFATYVRDNLDPELRAHVEFSNEHWNYGFDQFQDFAQGSRDAWGKTNAYQYFAKRATEVALIWDEVFGSEADERVVNVLGTHTANEGTIKQNLNLTLWEENDPENYVDPKTVFDAVAITTYFGSSTVSKVDLRDELFEKIKDPNVNANEWLRDKLLDPNYKHSIPDVVEDWKEIKSYIEPYGLKLLAYEGGQHVHHLAFLKGITNEEADEIAEFMGDFVRSEYMGELYAVLWDEWKKYGDGPFMQFGDLGETSKWGSFSAYSHLDDSNSRTRFLERMIKTEKPWW